MYYDRRPEIVGPFNTVLGGIGDFASPGCRRRVLGMSEGVGLQEERDQRHEYQREKHGEQRHRDQQPEGPSPAYPKQERVEPILEDEVDELSQGCEHVGDPVSSGCWTYGRVARSVSRTGFAESDLASSSSVVPGLATVAYKLRIRL